MKYISVQASAAPDLKIFHILFAMETCDPGKNSEGGQDGSRAGHKEAWRE